MHAGRTALLLRVLERWTALLLPLRLPVILGCTSASLIAGGYAAVHLTLNTDASNTFSAELPWRTHETTLINAFPHLRDSLRITVAAATADRARALAYLIHYRLPRRLFRNVYYPAAWPFHRRQELMYRDSSELATLAQKTEAAQPWLKHLHAHIGPAKLLALPASTDALGALLIQEIVHTLKAHTRGGRRPLSWSRLLLAGGDMSSHHEHITVRPRMDFEDFLPARKAVQYLHGLQSQMQTNLHLHGAVIQEHRGRKSLQHTLAYGLPLCAVLVLLVLVYSLRPLRVAAAAALTLAYGLMLGVGWAVAGNEELHTTVVPALLACAGTGVNWMVRYMHHLHTRHARGLCTAAAHARAGVALIPGVLPSLAGGLAMACSPWDALAQVGRLVSGTLLILFLLCISLLPALLYRTHTQRIRVTTPARSCLYAGMLAGLIAGTLPHTGTRTEITPPPVLQAPLVMLADDPAAAKALVPKLYAIPGILKVKTLFDWVPKEQEQKRKSLMRLAHMHHGSAPSTHRPTQLMPLQTLQPTMQDPATHPTIRQALLPLQRHLQRLPERALKQRLEALQSDLTAGLASALQALTEAVRGHPSSLQDLPVDQRVRWVTADGRYLVLAWPTTRAEPSALVRDVRRLASGVTGTLVVNYEYARAVYMNLWLTLALTGGAAAAAAFAWAGRRGPVSLNLALPTLAVVLVLGIMATMHMSWTHAAALPLVLILGVAGPRGPAAGNTLLGLTTVAACAGILVLMPHAGLAGMNWVLAAGAVLCALGTCTSDQRKDRSIAWQHQTNHLWI